MIYEAIFWTMGWVVNHMHTFSDMYNGGLQGQFLQDFQGYICQN